LVADIVDARDDVIGVITRVSIPVISQVIAIQCMPVTRVGNIIAVISGIVALGSMVVSVISGRATTSHRMFPGEGGHRLRRGGWHIAPVKPQATPQRASTKIHGHRAP
jgi:hypothetical protein